MLIKNEKKSLSYNQAGNISAQEAKLWGRMHEGAEGLEMEDQFHSTLLVEILQFLPKFVTQLLDYEELLRKELKRTPARNYQ
jgi:hypothetical protein